MKMASLLTFVLLCVVGCGVRENGKCAKPTDCASGLTCAKDNTCQTPEVVLARDVAQKKAADDAAAKVAAEQARRAELREKCSQSPECRRFGFCTPDNRPAGGCWLGADSDAGCSAPAPVANPDWRGDNALNWCKVGGLCASRDGVCVATPTGCKESELCTYFGHCEVLQDESGIPVCTTQPGLKREIQIANIALNTSHARHFDASIEEHRNIELKTGQYDLAATLLNLSMPVFANERERQAWERYRKGYDAGAVGAPKTVIGRYEIEGVGDTVYDSQTKLTWQRTVPETARTRNESKRYCQDLELAEKSDWRLPSKVELESLRREGSPAIDQAAFPQKGIGWYFWTANTVTSPAGAAFIVNFANGFNSDDGKLIVLDIVSDGPTSTELVRCVRQG